MTTTRASWSATGLRVGAAVMLTLGVVAVSGSSASPPLTASRAQILDAIRAVESRGLDPTPDGDGGRAIGPYQIAAPYWMDAAEQDLSLFEGEWFDCRDREYAERVIGAYMERYCPEAWAAGDAEIIARTHNGGPRGPMRCSTLDYWGRVKALLIAPAP
jgi:hypothetical protein